MVLHGESMKWTSIRKQVVKRGPKSTGINFFKDEVPYEKIGEWIEIKVPSNFGTFKSTDDEGIKRELIKENGAYLKARRQIYQNVFYHVIGNQMRKPELITTDNVLAFIKIRDSIEQYYNELTSDIIEKKKHIEEKINKSYDFTDKEKNGYKKIFFYVETYTTTMYIKEDQFSEYQKDFKYLDDYNNTLKDKDKIVLERIREEFSSVDNIIIDIAISDYYSKEPQSTKRLLEEHAKMIMNSIVRK